MVMEHMISGNIVRCSVTVSLAFGFSHIERRYDSTGMSCKRTKSDIRYERRIDTVQRVARCDSVQGIADSQI